MTTKFREWSRGAFAHLPDNNYNPPLIKLGGIGQPGTSSTATLLRTRVGITVAAAVGDPAVTSVPPERWWNHTELTVAARFSNVSSTDYGTAYSHDFNIVLTGSLYPRMVPSPTAPAEYHVTFEPPEGTLDSRAQRKWDGVTGAGAWVVLWVSFHDYEAAFDAGTYPGIDLWCQGFIETLWEVTA